MQVLELVCFRLADNDATSFLAANEAVNAWAQSQPGFVSRTLTEAEDGEWTDMVIWSGEAEAKAAAAEMNRVMGQFPAMMMIDPASIVMRHSTIRLAA
ncbi:hypothetical protein [uncultured Devosia sp.]|uniref:hypothetical protein n=1 Tax=uncultured Devosia sp. TaxID=211434 RepID=UPI00262BDB59|nr:hypothetical protein [uncultured Devosia sp.]